MFQKILSLLFILTLLVSADVVKQEYTFAKPFVKDGFAYLEGGRPGDYAFGPQVAVRASKVMLPVGKEAKTVKIEYGNLIEVEGNCYIEPYLPTYAQKDKKPINKTAMRREMQHLINAIYQKDELFPGIKSTRADERESELIYAAAIRESGQSPDSQGNNRQRDLE